MKEFVLLSMTNLFIVFYLLHAWSWDLPADSNLKRVMSFARKPVIWLGIWHSWKMFAPRPILVNSVFHVELTLSNGSVVEVHDPILSTTGVLTGFLDMREAKYQENLRNKVFKIHREAYCKFAIKNWAEDRTDVIQAKLIQVKQKIRRFGSTVEQPLERIELFNYRV